MDSRTLVKRLLADIVKSGSDKKHLEKVCAKLKAVVKDKKSIGSLQEFEGIQILISLLGKLNTDIIDLSLSILANACTEESCAKEALEQQVIPSLVTVFKAVTIPSIQCRACRLLSNIAKYDSEKKLSTFYYFFSHQMCQILNTAATSEQTHYQTVLMALRALRFLLKDPKFISYFLEYKGLLVTMRFLGETMKDESATTKTIDENVRDQICFRKEHHRQLIFDKIASNFENVRSDIFDYNLSLKNANATPQTIFKIPEGDREKSDVLCELLKCLLILSANHIPTKYWKQMIQYSITFEPIAVFLTGSNQHRAEALKILSDFSKQPAAFGVLIPSYITSVSCELLLETNCVRPLNEREKYHCLCVISVTAGDACSRGTIRRSGLIGYLIELMRNSKSHPEIALILFILNNFQYDTKSMQLMLSCGLVPLLIKELDACLTSEDEFLKRKREEKKNMALKRKAEDDANILSNSKRIAIDTCQDFNYSPSASPRSIFGSESPCSSRSMSPIYSKILENAEDSDNELYSPACSDDEDDDAEEKADSISNEMRSVFDNLKGEEANNQDSNVSEDDIMNLLNSNTRNLEIPIAEDSNLDRDEDANDGIVDQDEVQPASRVSRNHIDIIENLLYRITLLGSKTLELAKTVTIDTFIKAMHTFGINNNLVNSLTNILVESQFFALIIRQSIAHKIYGMTNSLELEKEAYGFLDTLTCVAESNYGKEILASFLRGDDDESKKCAAITVAYLIKTKQLLYQFLHDGGVLKILTNLIFNGEMDNERTLEGSDSFMFMCKHVLKFAMPVIANSGADDLETFDEEAPFTMTDGSSLEMDMKFLVYESGSNENESNMVTVAFNKELLCNASEVFQIMLNSDFREGRESVIRITGTCSVSGLKYFLNLIILCSKNEAFNVPPADKYYSLIEALEMGSMYLISKIEHRAEELLIILLKEANVLTLYQWSLRNYRYFLTESSINYYLSLKGDAKSKIELFRKAKSSPESKIWFDTINSTILTRCQRFP